MSSITRFGDFNRDGHEDVIARESATGGLWLYQGTGAELSSSRVEDRERVERHA